jgi:hypothetical protein
MNKELRAVGRVIQSVIGRQRIGRRVVIQERAYDGAQLVDGGRRRHAEIVT